MHEGGGAIRPTWVPASAVVVEELAVMRQIWL